ncbi:MAG: phosphoribosylamine--glycine ligase [Balneolia bacterium]|nr:phosphoribosylamine--glycine ligase [Balneolia bacterium]
MESINVLLIGSGGREHALAWALRNSPSIGKLFITPGNPGTEFCGENVELDIRDHEAVLAFIEANEIGLTVVGPEQPLVDGIVDFLETHGKAAFGPTSGAARLEGSKSFAKEIMQKYNVPTGNFRLFERNEWAAAEAFVEDNETWPMVLKADGLAAGKGVFISKNKAEAKEALEYMQNDPALSAASYRLVIEEYLEGEEVSVFAVCDGDTATILMDAQDHKRIGEGDTGLNTGGMGAYAPTPVLDQDALEDIRQRIVLPMVDAMAAEGIPYKGILYCGLMMTTKGPQVIEFNCRFGDPECQVILPALETDLIEIMMASVYGKLDYIDIKIDTESYYTCVVLASEGYPRKYEKGKAITGIPADSDNLHVFHSGTKKDDDGRLVTNGGRVLNVVSKADTLSDSIHKAYDAVSNISFDGMYYRKDIGAKGLKRF